MRAALARHRLAEMGRAEVPAAEGPDGVRGVVLLGPDGPGFWDHVTAEPEFADGLPDPLDRWSRRAVGEVAAAAGAAPLYPFGGPPWHPFVRWAVRCGSIRVSPVGLLVHGRAGLWVSFRGALGFRQAPEPDAETDPCKGCAAPCVTACPVDALSDRGYDVPRCRAYVASPEGRECRELGCAVRRACPVAAAFGRRPAQSAFHMAAFAGESAA